MTTSGNVDRLAAVRGLVAEALELVEELPYSGSIQHHLSEVLADLEFVLAAVETTTHPSRAGRPVVRVVKGEASHPTGTEMDEIGW